MHASETSLDSPRGPSGILEVILSVIEFLCSSALGLVRDQGLLEDAYITHFTDIYLTTSALLHLIGCIVRSVETSRCMVTRCIWLWTRYIAMICK